MAEETLSKNKNIPKTPQKSIDVLTFSERALFNCPGPLHTNETALVFCWQDTSTKTTQKAPFCCTTDIQSSLLEKGAKLHLKTTDEFPSSLEAQLSFLTEPI